MDNEEKQSLELGRQLTLSLFLIRVSTKQSVLLSTSPRSLAEEMKFVLIKACAASCTDLCRARLTTSNLPVSTGTIVYDNTDEAAL